MFLASSNREVIFSPCRTYRYKLTRCWDKRLPHVAFIMLNPSIADEIIDDATTRRCFKFAHGWGYGAVTQANLFALRGSDPSVLLKHNDPIGPENDSRLIQICMAVDLVVFAWGAHPAVAARELEVIELLSGLAEPMCLGITKGGHPKHPLYLPAGTQLVAY